MNEFKLIRSREDAYGRTVAVVGSGCPWMLKKKLTLEEQRYANSCVADSSGCLGFLDIVEVEGLQFTKCAN